MSRRHIISSTAIIVAVVLIASGFVAYQKPVAALTPNITQTESLAAKGPALAWPAATEAAIGATNYGVLAMHGTQQTLPTASTAKVMLALLVLKQHPLKAGQQGPTLTLTQADVNLYNKYVAEDGSVAKVVKGEKITEYQALEALLLPSADNIADTLAIWSYGSISAYSTAANSMAASLGIHDTHFGTTDASGLSPTTVSTAHDLVLLGLAAVNNPVVAQIVAKPAATIPVAGTAHNYNWLLGSDGVTGIKTGNSDQAGGVFLFSAKKTFSNGQSINIVGVVMDTSATLNQALDEAVPLIQSAEADFVLTTLVHASQIMGTYDVPWFGAVNAVATKPLTAITWRGQDVTPKVSLQTLHAPANIDNSVGTVSFGITSQTVPVALSQAIAAPSWHWRLSHIL